MPEIAYNAASKFGRVLLVLLLVAASAAVSARDIQGKVVRVLDGDTLVVLTEGNEQVRVRLASIDAPEKGQPFGERARQALAAAVFSRFVRVRVETADRYGRTLGTVLADGQNVNAQMVADGYAWVYRAYSRDPELLALEAQARQSRKGLWADANPVPPWEWRRKPKVTR